MFEWLFGEKSSKQSGARHKGLLTPDLEKKRKKLAALRAQAAKQTVRANESGDAELKVHEIRERVAKITRRNKPRSILVIPFSDVDNPLVDILLDANSNAKPTFATSVSHAQAILERREFDMVYAVVEFNKKDCGPCFFSIDKEDEDFKKRNGALCARLDKISDMTRAEIVVVCGTSASQCPVAKKLCKERRARRRFDKATIKNLD